MDRNPPQFEALPNMNAMPEAEASVIWHRTPRARLFSLVFVTTIILGVLLTFIQPTIYRASATVLMTAPTAIDDEETEANVQSVAIQRRVLMGGTVTRKLLEVLDEELGIGLDRDYLREVLAVAPVAETNLVEMVAMGEDANILPALVHTWIDVYLAIRSAHVEQSQRQTLEVVENQLSELEIKLEKARKALADYRDEHSISSAERQENAELAKLNGLNKALNKAIESEILAQAYVDTLRKAIAEGKNVVPQSERKSVDRMSAELNQLQAQMKNLQRKYTIEYITHQPAWRDIPGRIQELDAALAVALDEGKREALDQAQQSHDAAVQTVKDLELRLVDQQERAAKFTTIYATHQALAEDLAELEALNRETQSRLVQVEVNQVEKYPQVSVIDRPADESVRVGPDYRIWLGGTVLAALGLGILGVWLYGFLGPREKPSVVTLQGVHMYPQDVGGLAYNGPADPRLEQTKTQLLQQDDGGQNAISDADDITPDQPAPDEDNK